MNMLSWEWQPSANTHHVDYTQPEKSKTQMMKDYNRVYREKHSAYVQCGCGSRFKEISKYTHQHTARHTKWLADKGPPSQ